MSRHFMTRLTANALIVVLAYTPILGSVTGTLAAAQALQNTTATYQYDANGNRIKITNPLGKVTDHVFDPLNRVKQLMQPTTGAIRPTVQYGYDGQGQVAKVTDPRNLVTSYAIDGLGNRTVLTSPDTGIANLIHDLAGNVTARTDARGKTSTYAYDTLNRVTRISFTSGAETTFLYDKLADGTVVPNAVGQLTRITDESGSTNFSYDAFSRVQQRVITIGAGATAKTYTVGQTYGSSGSANGKLTSLSYPSGNRINYEYGSAGRIVALTLNPGLVDGSTDQTVVIPLLTNMRYTSFGGVSGWTWGNDSPAVPNVYTRNFDIDGRLTAYPLGNGAAEGVQRTVVYDAASRITAMTHTGTGTSPVPATLDQSFGYDELDRLTSFSANATGQTYQYDATGNRNRATFGASVYPNTVAPTSNRLSAAAGPLPSKTYTYDAAGNITGDGSSTFAYSDRGRRKSVTVAGGTVSYLYNGFDQRVRKSGPIALVDSGIGDYVYDDEGRTVGEYDKDGAALQETVYLGDLPVVTLRRSSAGTMEVHYIHADHINTPRVITRSSDNKIVWRWDQSDPFGLAPPNDNPSALSAHVYNPRFPGQVFDKETNLHYNYYRDYDPQTGRYVQSDPIGLDGGINTYGYVEGNPVSFVDPDGLQARAAAGRLVAPRVPSAGLVFPGDEPLPSTSPKIKFPDVGEANTYLLLKFLGPTLNVLSKEECPPSKEECDRQWDKARATCRALIYEQMQQRAGRRKPRSVTGVTGGYYNVEDCAVGLVSQACGGNLVDHGGRK